MGAVVVDQLVEWSLLDIRGQLFESSHQFFSHTINYENKEKRGRKRPI